MLIMNHVYHPSTEMEMENLHFVPKCTPTDPNTIFPTIL